MVSAPASMSTPCARHRGRRAFTLIELIAVMVVLAILSAVALPKYLDYVSRANSSAVQGALGGIRTALHAFAQHQLVVNGIARYPTLAELTTEGLVVEGKLPRESYSGSREVRAVTQVEAAARSTAGTEGWCYYVDNSTNPPQCVFYANCPVDTEVLDDAGQPVQANEL